MRTALFLMEHTEENLPSERDELEALKLDEVFKENLTLIRPHILNIKSVADANLCGIWIERLNRCSTQERVIRNLYICELRHLVKIGHLKPPFNSLPPDGPLKQFSPETNNISISSLGDVSETSNSQLHHHDLVEESSFSIEDSMSVTSVSCNCHGKFSQLQQQYKQQMTADQVLINRYKRALSFVLSSQNPDEYSLISVEKLENLYDNKVTVLKSEIQELKNENEILQLNLENLKKSHEQCRTDSEWNTLYEEINILKKKLADVQNSKTALEKSHKEVILDHQQEIDEAINHLCCRVNQAQNKNRAVEMKLLVALDHLERLFLLLKKEKNVPTIEDTKHIKMKSGDCCDVNSKQIDLKALVTSKNEEVLNLEEVLKAECYKMQEQVNVIKDDLKFVSENKDRKFRAKVYELQKIVDKHTRTKAKLLKIYNYKLCCLQKERHFEVKNLELQLHTQRAEIVACLSRDKHTELEIVVANLEERYKEMLMDSERKFCSRQEEDQTRIFQLEEELKNLRSDNRKSG